MFRGYWRVGIIARWFLKPVRPMIYMQMREPNPVWSGGPRTRSRCPIGRMAKGGPEASARIGTIKSAPGRPVAQHLQELFSFLPRYETRQER